MSPLRAYILPLGLRAFLEASKQPGEGDKGTDAAYSTGCAGRPTSKPLLETEMRRRAASGELLPTLSAECEYLERWLSEAHSEASPTTAKTIKNSLRHVYRELKKAQIIISGLIAHFQASGIWHAHTRGACPVPNKTANLIPPN